MYQKRQGGRIGYAKYLSDLLMSNKRCAAPSFFPYKAYPVIDGPTGHNDVARHHDDEDEEPTGLAWRANDIDIGDMDAQDPENGREDWNPNIQPDQQYDGLEGA